jgi:hypothetical protein
LQHSNGNMHRDVNFVRVVQDWELESMVSLMDILYSSEVKEMERKNCVV